MSDRPVPLGLSEAKLIFRPVLIRCMLMPILPENWDIDRSETSLVRFEPRESTMVSSRGNKNVSSGSTFDNDALSGVVDPN